MEKDATISFCEFVLNIKNRLESYISSEVNKNTSITCAITSLRVGESGGEYIMDVVCDGELTISLEQLGDNRVVVRVDELAYRHVYTYAELKHGNSYDRVCSDITFGLGKLLLTYRKDRSHLYANFWTEQLDHELRQAFPALDRGIEGIEYRGIDSSFLMFTHIKDMVVYHYYVKCDMRNLKLYATVNDKHSIKASILNFKVEEFAKLLSEAFDSLTFINL